MAFRQLFSLVFLTLSTGPAWADQDHEREVLASDRPEAWALAYLSAATLLTAAGAPTDLATGQWQWAVDLAQIPRLDEAQQQVGFNGIKREDLNKSPLFGRLRARLGLPAGWRVELGYTPPLQINGVRPRDLLAVAFNREVISGEAGSLALRAFGQHGGLRGDITCPARLAGDTDPNRNRYGCQAPSRDRVTLNQYGLALLLATQTGAWRWHSELGALRSESAVQVDALVYDFHDQSHLVANHGQRYLTLGLSHALGERWRWTAEILHLPLRVRRGEGQPREHDSFTGLRLQLAYRR